MGFVIISGLSGAGKSKAGEFLEDAGFYTVDNMPAVLMPRFAELCMDGSNRYNRVALVSDVRGGQDFTDLFQALDEMKKMGCHCELLFLEASTAAIIKRYKETRRMHPFCAEDDSLSLEEAITKEKALMAQVRNRADIIIDSTSFDTTAKLRSALLEQFGVKNAGKMSVRVMSFGYKYGAPLEADWMLDVRFLPNPFYVTELRKLTGLDEPVREFLYRYQETTQFINLMRTNLEFLLPLYEQEGKTALTIAVGCTGGQHRSVALCHAITELVRTLDYPVSEHHRDMARDRK